jgi:hypothetical protein
MSFDIGFASHVTSNRKKDASSISSMQTEKGKLRLLKEILKIHKRFGGYQVFIVAEIQRSVTAAAFTAHNRKNIYQVSQHTL